MVLCEIIVSNEKLVEFYLDFIFYSHYTAPSIFSSKVMIGYTRVAPHYIIEWYQVDMNPTNKN